MVQKSPGWYPAPDGNGRQWWNGVDWSEARQGATHAPVAPAMAVTSTTPPPVYSAENPPPSAPGVHSSGGARGYRTIQLGQRRTATIDAKVNRNAMIGFITGLIAVFFNVLFLLAPVAIIYSVMGLSRARTLKASGATTTLAGFAWAGLAMGIFSLVMSAIPIIVFVVSLTTFQSAIPELPPASGLLPYLFGS